MTTHFTPLPIGHLPAERPAPQDPCARQIIGYQFDADLYCPAHIIAALPTGPGGAFDGWALAHGVVIRVEDNLDEIALAFGIDRRQAASFDSSEFPAVLLAQDVISAEDAECLADGTTASTCGTCHEPLVD